MAFLIPDKVRTEYGLVIKEKIIPWGARWIRNWREYEVGDLYKADRLLSDGTGKVKKITIHNTDDIAEAKGTNDAEQYARATWPNQNMGDARVHYFIDETDCWQLLREDEVGWHAGDNRGPGNETSLAIEIIMNGSGSQADIEAENRGAKLAAILLNRHGLTINDVVTHKSWSGKDCPVYILPHWDEFKAKVNKYLNEIQGEKNVDIIYRVQVGAYSKKENAITMKDKLKAAGFDAIIVSNDVKTEKKESPFKTGDIVKVRKDAPVYGKTNKFQEWVYHTVMYITGITDDRAVISIRDGGPVTGAVDVKYLTKV